MDDIQTRNVVASQYILQFENILDDLQNNVTDILQNTCSTIETDRFSKDIHTLFDPLRSNLKKCFISCSNISKLQSKLEEIYKTVDQYIEINKSSNSNLLTSNEYLVILETITKTQRKIITDLLVPDEDILSISYNNIIQNVPSPTASYSRRKDSVCSCSSPIHTDEPLDNDLNETSKSLLETVKNKLISYQCEFENNLVERFVSDSREKDEQIQMLEMELESCKQNSNFDEIRKEYEPIIDELENQIKQLKNDNKDLLLDYEFVLSNISSLANIESNNDNNDNDENGVFTDGLTPSSCYIDNLEKIQKDLMTMNKELKGIIERKNLYINSLDLEKIEKYNENIKAVDEIVKESIDHPNKLLAKQFQQISLLIKNIGDISQDYQNMKNQIKDEMRLEMKESYRAIEQEHTFKYQKLLEKYQKEVEQHSLDKSKYEKLKIDTNLLISWYKEELKQYLESYPMEDDNDNIDTEDPTTIDGPKRYKDLLYEYHLQHHQSTLKDVTIQYLRGVLDKEKKKRIISNQRFVDMIKDFDDLKKQYLKLLISDNTKISELNSLRSTLKHTLLERKENGDEELNDIPLKEVINPFQFDTSIDLVVDKIDETLSDINEICNIDEVPKTGKETVYSKWSKKITELEDIIEQKDDSLNDKEFLLKQNNKLIELESKIREKDNQINDFVVQLNEIQNGVFVMEDIDKNEDGNGNNDSSDVSTNSKKFKNLLKEKEKKIDELNQTLEDLTIENDNMKYLLDGSRESTIDQLSLLPTNIKLTVNEYSDLNIFETSIEDVEDVSDTAEYQALLHDFDLLTIEYNKLKSRKGDNENGEYDDNENDNLESRKLDEALVENEELKLELQNADELNADLQAEISSLRYKLENKEDKSLNKEFDIDEMKIEIDNYKSQIKLLEEQHHNDADNYESELLSKDEELIKLRDEYERLQKEMELLKNSDEISKEGIDENAKEIQNLSLQLDEKDEVIINYEEEIDKLKNRVSKLENDLQNKKNETSILEDNLADVSSLQSAYDLLLVEKSIYEEENQKLKKQLDDLNLHIQNNNDNFLADLRSQYESKLQELQDQVNRITLSPVADDNNNTEDNNNNNNNNGEGMDLRRSKKIGIEDLQKQNELVWNENRNLRDKLRQIETKLLVLETSKQVEIEEKDQIINSLNEQLKKSNEGNINAMKKRYENRIIELTNELNELKALQTIKEETNEQNYSSIVFEKNAQIMNLKMENSQLKDGIESIKEEYDNKIHELETRNILLQDSMETLTKTNSTLKEKINEQLNLISQNQSTDYELQMLRKEKEKNMEIISQLQKTIETIELLKNQPELLAKYIDQTDRIKDLTSLLDEQTKRYVIEISEMSNYVNELKSDKSLLQLDYETLYSQYLNEKKKNDEENSDKIHHLKELEDEIKRITKDNDYETCEFLQSYAKKLIKTVESDMEVETHLYKDYISQNLSQIITLLQALYDQLIKKDGKMPKSKELRNKLEDIRILIQQYPDAMTSALQISKKDRRDIKILKRNGKHFEEYYKKVKNEKMKQEKKFNEERRKWRYDYYRKLRIIQEECDQKVASLCSRLRKIEEKHNKEVKELGKNYWDKFLKAEKANRNRLLSLRSNDTSYQYNGKDYGRARRQSTLLLKALAPLPEEKEDEEKKGNNTIKSSNANNNKTMKNAVKKVSNGIKTTKLMKPTTKTNVKPITKSAPIAKRKVKEDNKRPLYKTQMTNKPSKYESKLRKPTVKAVTLATIGFSKKSNNKPKTQKVEDVPVKKTIRSTIPSHIIPKSKKLLKKKVNEDSNDEKSKIPRSPKMKRMNNIPNEKNEKEEEEKDNEETTHTMIPKPGTIHFNKEDNDNNTITNSKSLSNSRRISKIKPPTDVKLSFSSNDNDNIINNQMSMSVDGRRRISKIKPPTNLSSSYRDKNSQNLKQFSNKDLPPPKPINRNKQMNDLAKSKEENEYDTPEKRNRVNSIEPLLDNSDSEPSMLTNFLKPPSEYANIISKRKSTLKKGNE